MATAKKTAKKKLSPKKKAPAQAKPAEVKNKVGRPPIYDQEVADKICEQIACTSKSLRTICAEQGMPSVGTVLKWLRENSEFLAQYTRAKEEQADFLIEEMIDISDDGSNDLMTITKGDISYEQENKEVTSRSKLRVETRKWIASKLKPKKYGEKLDVTGNIKHKIGKELADEIYE
jgi:hypothetical protein